MAVLAAALDMVAPEAPGTRAEVAQAVMLVQCWMTRRDADVERVELVIPTHCYLLGLHSMPLAYAYDVKRSIVEVSAVQRLRFDEDFTRTSPLTRTEGRAFLWTTLLGLECTCVLPSTRTVGAGTRTVTFDCGTRDRRTRTLGRAGTCCVEWYTRDRPVP